MSCAVNMSRQGEYLVLEWLQDAVCGPPCLS